ncbi:DUF2267 domain-containing protein [Myxococcus sp. CA051A]|uniref:DUF2267 domain-containing protein n=1 Tax=unclassified Myxococcus TaxID=2648731 RepID=UPI00157B1A18|nr:MULTISPECIES: DUF2267 domain-containing protein [unclassified Myxococcus]NTX10803.1 DUF2267 domain-containing protein [Myxococcus sp. CA056]NTX37309.1 DUF2267 domain-containing protein [Myxococcus sp. CA033]NTX57565.1 DUF2267 domain-containing protein [Myxococcus sp. CA039A]NTX66143.1 DUF2267 domain-containing protein [Myxococcus sp. CA051A]
MSIQKQETTQSWSGLGVGTDRKSFMDAVSAQLPDFEAEQAAEAVFRGLSELLSDGLMRQLREQLPEDLRGLVDACPRHPDSVRGKVDRDDFYLQVANHLNAEPENVRLVLHGVFAALREQVTEQEADKIESQLPRWLQGTWSAARIGIDRPS